MRASDLLAAERVQQAQQAQQGPSPAGKTVAVPSGSGSGVRRRLSSGAAAVQPTVPMWDGSFEAWPYGELSVEVQV